MKLELIAAVDSRWGLGRAGQLLFSIPADLRHFKSRTWGHPLIFGRKTLQTFPQQKPLPGRRNLILSRNQALSIPGAEVCHSISQLEALLPPEETAFVAGGAEVYHLLLPYCTRAHITHVEADGHADVFLSPLPGWTLAAEGEPQSWNGLTYTFREYIRRKDDTKTP